MRKWGENEEMILDQAGCEEASQFPQLCAAVWIVCNDDNCIVTRRGLMILTAMTI